MPGEAGASARGNNLFAEQPFDGATATAAAEEQHLEVQQVADTLGAGIKKLY